MEWLWLVWVGRRWELSAFICSPGSAENPPDHSANPLWMHTAQESLIYLSFPFVINFCKFVNKMNAKERKMLTFDFQCMLMRAVGVAASFEFVQVVMWKSRQTRSNELFIKQNCKRNKDTENLINIGSFELNCTISSIFHLLFVVAGGRTNETVCHADKVRNANKGVYKVGQIKWEREREK